MESVTAIKLVKPCEACDFLIDRKCTAGICEAAEIFQMEHGGELPPVAESEEEIPPVIHDDKSPEDPPTISDPADLEGEVNVLEARLIETYDDLEEAFMHFRHALTDMLFAKRNEESTQGGN